MSSRFPRGAAAAMEVVLEEEGPALQSMAVAAPMDDGFGIRTALASSTSKDPFLLPSSSNKGRVALATERKLAVPAKAFVVAPVIPEFYHGLSKHNAVAVRGPVPQVMDRIEKILDSLSLDYKRIKDEPGNEGQLGWDCRSKNENDSSDSDDDDNEGPYNNSKIKMEYENDINYSLCFCICLWQGRSAATLGQTIVEVQRRNGSSVVVQHVKRTLFATLSPPPPKAATASSKTAMPFVAPCDNKYLTSRMIPTRICHEMMRTSTLPPPMKPMSPLPGLQQLPPALLIGGGNSNKP